MNSLHLSHRQILFLSHLTQTYDGTAHHSETVDAVKHTHYLWTANVQLHWALL